MKKSNEKEPTKTLWDKYETDPRKESQGVPVEVDGVTFYVRRAGGGNRAYRYALTDAAKKYVHLVRAEPRDNVAVFAANESMQKEAFAKTVLVGWSDNMTDRMGDPLPFSEAAALDLLNSCPAIWDTLQGAAIDDALFKPEKDGEELGKSFVGGTSGATG